VNILEAILYSIVTDMPPGTVHAGSGQHRVWAGRYPGSPGLSANGAASSRLPSLLHSPHNKATVTDNRLRFCHAGMEIQDDATIKECT
jgi:hypothetical protein